MNRGKVFSVSSVNQYIKNMFSREYALSVVFVRGEVSNCKYHSRGHIYFKLKDETGTIDAVMFAGNRKRGLLFPMKEGDMVIVTGSIEVYERDGKYQLYAKEITADGAGDLYVRFEQLKRELEEMGMFAPEYKQPIPAHIRTLGVVTAPTGAAIQDIRNVAGRRNPFVQIILYPALVQGEGAKESIVQGIQRLDDYGVDVIIVGRGGGSIEDLWAFNEEVVARAIFHCRTPVISAVGHETDTTIADFVADLRAPTPSAAAELAVSDVRTLLGTFQEYRKKLERIMDNRLLLLEQQMKFYKNKLLYLSPENQIREKRTYLLELEARMDAGMQNQIYRARQELNLYIERMRGLSPLDKLNQGFSYVENEEQKAVTSISQVKTGDRLYIQVSDGTVEARAENRKKKSRGVSNGRKDNN